MSAAVTGASIGSFVTSSSVTISAPSIGNRYIVALFPSFRLSITYAWFL
jgi:hypothetical protein